jgi:hypothetical protein
VVRKGKVAVTLFARPATPARGADFALRDFLPGKEKTNKTLLNDDINFARRPENKPLFGAKRQRIDFELTS